MRKGCFHDKTHAPKRKAGMRLTWADQGIKNLAASRLSPAHVSTGMWNKCFPEICDLGMEHTYFPFHSLFPVSYHSCSKI